MILPLAFLVGRGLWSVQELFFFSFIGTIMVDLFWFLLARLGKEWKFLNQFFQKDSKIKKFAQKFSKHEATLLLMTKFIYGTRVISVFYLSLDGLRTLRFLILNILVTIPWLTLIIAMGWLAGRGSVFFGNILRHPALFTIGIVALVLIFQWIRKQIEKKMLPG